MLLSEILLSFQKLRMVIFSLSYMWYSEGLEYTQFVHNSQNYTSDSFKITVSQVCLVFVNFCCYCFECCENWFIAKITEIVIAKITEIDRIICDFELLLT